MILPDLILPGSIKQYWQYSGLDSADKCVDLDHFLCYPHQVSYSYNSRGFRDQEWPIDSVELAQAIWCVGDSFTTGIGSPVTATWPQRLSAMTNRRIINVSMDGASNEWIARVAQRINQVIMPDHMAIMWSYTHRREHSNTLLDSESRRIHATKSTVQQDLDNLLYCKQQVDLCRQHSVHLAVPGVHYGVLTSVPSCWAAIRGSNWPVHAPGTLAELNALPAEILLEISRLHKCLDAIEFTLNFEHFLKTQHNIVLVQQLDMARDGHHFDSITADWVAKQIAPSLD